jgi:hypothetical protein
MNPCHPIRLLLVAHAILEHGHLFHFLKSTLADGLVGRLAPWISTTMGLVKLVKLVKSPTATRPAE